MNAKPFFQSKTIWLQILAILSLMLPPVQEWLDKNPESFVVALSAVATIVRFVTSGRVSLFGDDQKPSGPAANWAVVLMGSGLLAAAALALSACAGVTGSIFYRDPGSGAKAGMTWAGGAGEFFGRLPVIDEKTGEVIGSAEVMIPMKKRAPEVRAEK